MNKAILTGLAAIAAAAGLSCAKDIPAKSDEYVPECAYIGQEVYEGKTLEMYKCEVWKGSYYWLRGYTQKVSTGLYSGRGQLRDEQWLIRKDKEGHCETMEYHFESGPFPAYSDEGNINQELYDYECDGTVDVSDEGTWGKGFNSMISTNRTYFGDSLDAGFAEAWQRFEEYFGTPKKGQ